MSFLGNIVKSIGTDQGPPPKPPSRPSSANTTQSATGTPKPGARPSLTHTPSSLAGAKRKADDGASNGNGKAGKTSVIATAGNENRKGPAPPLNAPKPLPDKASAMPKSETTRSSSPLPGKPAAVKADSSLAIGTAKPAPSKGSYADLMARAKQTAEHRPQAPQGTILHQDTAKKLSKLAERRKEEQEKVRAQKAGNGKQVKQDSRRSASPQKKEDVKELKPSKAPPKAGYKGTMGINTSRKGPYHSPKKSKYDDYLGTDEEDNSDIDDDHGGYDSEGSSDMEAGFDDEIAEDQGTLRLAKQDDAREAALENQLKREKEERRKKLMQMANKRK